MLDVNNTIDLVKIKLYNEWIYTSHIQPEQDAEYNRSLTENAIKNYIEPLNLPKDAVILDIACGPGYFLDAMKNLGYTNVTGITLSPEDIETCKKKGHTVKQHDMSFLPQKNGFIDESVDLIFCRQALEHSPYPLFSLMEYNRLLKQPGFLYVETPAIDTDRKHEFYSNHYSVFGTTQLGALLQKTGFNIRQFNVLDFSLKVELDGDEKTINDKAYCVLTNKQRPLDIK